MYRDFFSLLAYGWIGLVCFGCNQQTAVDPAVVERYRSQLVMADEPDGARTVVEIRNAMYGVEESAEAHDHEHQGESGQTDSDATDTQVITKTDEHDEPVDPEHLEGDEHGDNDHDHAVGEAGHEHDHGEVTTGKEPVIDEMDVVLVGSVGGVPNPSEQSHPEFPFAANQAVFFLADPEAVAEMEEHEHEHAPGEECSFCAAHAGDSASLIAVVQFAEQGKPIPVDVRQLFDLKEKETVVVKGKAKIAGGILTVDADGLYVRR